MFLTAGRVEGQTIWQAGDENWHTAANWTAGVPHGGIDAWINNSGTAWLYGADNFGAGQVRDLYLGVDSTVNADSGVIEMFDAGDSFGPGALYSRTAFVGYTDDGYVEMYDGSTWTNCCDLIVGYQHIGGLGIFSASHVSSSRGFIGDFANGIGGVEVDGDGSTWAISGVLRVGNVGTGGLQISGGGDVSNSIGYIGYLSSLPNEGGALVDGAGSTWTNSGELYVGRAGQGTLNIANGGTVSNTGGYIGDFGGIVGTATVNGVGSKWTNSINLFVGNQGTGELNIENGGEVTNVGGFVGRLNYAGSTGTANVSGTGSKWTNSGNLVVGYQGAGALNVTSGGTISNADGFIGDFNSAVGTATVNGTGSTWANTGELRVGNQGTGILNIQNGGAVTAYTAYIGHNNEFPDSGTVNVDGPGSTFTNEFELYVGRAGSGSMSITHGGAVIDDNGLVGYGNAAFASTDLVTVNGAGSTWTNNNWLFVGHESSAELHIQNGGQVTSTLGALGTFPNSSGAIIVEGIGSTWTNNSHIRVGWQGEGMLGVYNGGTVTSATAVIGEQSASAGVAIVDGTGSAWSNSGQLQVGSSGTGTLSVQNGGTVSAVGGLAIATTGTVLGNGTVSANVTNSGVVAPGTSPGTLHIISNYTQSSSGKLQIEIGAASFDRLDVDGNVTLGGMLQVSLFDGYVPSGNHSFDILDWGNLVGGTFFSVQLPTLGGILTWNDSQLYTSGILSVTGPSLSGDYNGDGTVDAADFTVWRDHLGQTFTLTNENPAAATPGVVDTEDYAFWKSHFGNSLGNGSGAAGSASAAVPEPATLMMIIVAIVAMFTRQERLCH